MKQKQQGFTLIELLVVIAIIGFLASIVLVAMNNARVRSRDAKRLGDMSQLQKALEFFYNSNRGYPVATGNGLPDLTANEVKVIPTSPLPADGSCGGLQNPYDEPANSYYYAPTGALTTVNGLDVYSDYNYYFCIGRNIGDYSAGRKVLTPRGTSSY